MSGYCERCGETAACCCNADGKEYVRFPGGWFDYFLSLGLAPDKAEAAEKVILKRHMENVAQIIERIASLEAANAEQARRITELEEEREALEKQEPVGTCLPAWDAKWRKNLKLPAINSPWCLSLLLYSPDSTSDGGRHRIPLYARPVPARTLDVEWLSNVIREVDGGHTLGAGALAEAIAPRIERHLKGEQQ